MKTIFFSGFKGGTGKTTLAVNFCRYLQFYEKQKVTLVDTDELNLLAILCKDSEVPINVISHTEIVDHTFISSFSNQNFLVVDCSSQFSPENLTSLQVADYFIVPFQYSVLDYCKMDAFVHTVINVGKKLNDIMLLPNQFSERMSIDTTARSLISQNSKMNKLHMLPTIPRSTRFMELGFGPPDPTIFNYMRPAFNNIMNKIT